MMKLMAHRGDLELNMDYNYDSGATFQYSQNFKLYDRSKRKGNKYTI
jgi:hypothetical protein